MIPEHRGLGLGRALVLQALQGFVQVGMGISVLEVTADNEAAVKLYQTMGFRTIQVLYRDSFTGETMTEDEAESQIREWPGRISER